MSGRKDDNGKPPLSMIAASAQLAEARVMAHGAVKYGRDNWRGGMAWTRLVDALQRHTLAFANGENDDPETGLPHMAHVRCCAAFLIEYVEQGLGTDDRHTAVTVESSRAYDTVALVTMTAPTSNSFRWNGWHSALTDSGYFIRVPPNVQLNAGDCVWARPLERDNWDFVSKFVPSLPDDGQDTP